MEHEICFELKKEVGELIYSGLANFNKAYFPSHEHIDFTCTIKNEENELIGGLVGVVLIQSLNIKFFWLPEAYRKKGIGTSLLKAVELEAIKRRLSSITLDTYSFQAPEFYEKMGYKMVGQYTNYPISGVNKMFFQKNLQRN